MFVGKKLVVPVLAAALAVTVPAVPAAAHADGLFQLCARGVVESTSAAMTPYFVNGDFGGTTAIEVTNVTGPIPVSVTIGDISGNGNPDPTGTVSTKLIGQGETFRFGLWGNAGDNLRPYQFQLNAETPFVSGVKMEYRVYSAKCGGPLHHWDIYRQRYASVRNDGGEHCMGTFDYPEMPDGDRTWAMSFSGPAGFEPVITSSDSTHGFRLDDYGRTGYSKIWQPVDYVVFRDLSGKTSGEPLEVPTTGATGEIHQNYWASHRFGNDCGHGPGEEWLEDSYTQLYRQEITWEETSA
ncbi:hypothetical protein [Amycolatopsis sp. NPDC004378]